MITIDLAKKTDEICLRCINECHFELNSIHLVPYNQLILFEQKLKNELLQENIVFDDIGVSPYFHCALNGNAESITGCYTCHLWNNPWREKILNYEGLEKYLENNNVKTYCSDKYWAVKECTKQELLENCNCAVSKNWSPIRFYPELRTDMYSNLLVRKKI